MYICMYIYIYIARERERYIYIYMQDVYETSISNAGRRINAKSSLTKKAGGRSSGGASLSLSAPVV